MSECVFGVWQPSDCNCCGMGAVNYWSKRLNPIQGPLWLQNDHGSSRERQRTGKLFLPSGDRGRVKGEAERRWGETAADRKAQLVAGP